MASYVPRKIIHSDVDKDDDEESVSKKCFKLATKLHSIADRQHDRWNIDKANGQLQIELSLLRSFVIMFISLFQEHISKCNDEPFDKTSKCDRRSVMLFAYLKNESLNKEDLVEGTNSLLPNMDNGIVF